MSKFNPTQVVPVNRVTNVAGGVGYSESAKSELVSLLMTSLVEDKFYESAESQAGRLVSLVNQVDPVFAAKAAVVARDMFGMRSITHLVGAALAPAKFPEKRSFYRNLVVRPDDVLEVLAAYWGGDPDGRSKKPLPNAMKRGFRDALSGMSADRLAKYKNTDKSVNMYDAIALLRPNGEGVSAFWNGDVKSADTWEVALSSGQDKAQTWTSLVLENKLGIMALLRNLRNIVENCGDNAEVMNAVYEQLTNRDAIMRSRLFPYRFLAAYETFMNPNFGVRQVTAPQKLLSAINQAVEISLVNVPELSGSSGLLLDISGSMHAMMSRNSQMRMVDAGSMLGAMLFKKNPDSELVKFGTYANKFNVNADMPLLEIAKSFSTEDGLGYGTNLEAGFQALSGRHDRVIIVSDMQTWIGRGGQTAWKNYNNRTGANSFGYEINLGGYGTTALNSRDSREFHLPTITDKIFILMGGLESGGDGLLRAIENTHL